MSTDIRLEDTFDGRKILRVFAVQNSRPAAVLGELTLNVPNLEVAQLLDDAFREELENLFQREEERRPLREEILKCLKRTQRPAGRARVLKLVRKRPAESEASND